MGMDLDLKTEILPDPVVQVEVSDDDDNNSTAQMRTIDNNIEKCINELRESFENLTCNMVVVQNVRIDKRNK